MSEPFLAEVRIVGFNFAPRGWAFCDGQILPINQNQSLYSLLGTTYGGDGRTSFALPDLRGRVPIHRGSANGTDHQLGTKGGEETHSLSAGELAAHNHVVQATGDGADANVPNNTKVYARSAEGTYHALDAPQTTDLSSNVLTPVGGGQAHDNMMPYLALNFCIALAGLFPSRN